MQHGHSQLPEFYSSAGRWLVCHVTSSPNQRQCQREVEKSTAKSKRPTQGQTAQRVFNRPNARSDSLMLSRSNQCKGKRPDWCSKERNGAATDHQQFLDHHPRNAAWRCQLTFAVPLRGFLVSFASLSALKSPGSGPSRAQALGAQGSRLGLEIWQAQALESRA